VWQTSTARVTALIFTNCAEHVAHLIAFHLKALVNEIQQLKLHVQVSPPLDRIIFKSCIHYGDAALRKKLEHQHVMKMINVNTTILLNL